MMKHGMLHASCIWFLMVEV